MEVQWLQPNVGDMFCASLLAAHQAVLAAVQEAHSSHYPVSEGLRDQQAQFHAKALH